MKCLLFWSYQPGGQMRAPTEPATKWCHFILPDLVDWGYSCTYIVEWGHSCTLILPMHWHIVPNLLPPWAAQPSYRRTMLKTHIFTLPLGKKGLLGRGGSILGKQFVFALLDWWWVNLVSWRRTWTLSFLYCVTLITTFHSDSSESLSSSESVGCDLS